MCYLFSNHTAVILNEHLFSNHTAVILNEQVGITVLDVNDNSPRFADPASYSAVIRKDAEVGSFVYGFRALDPDMGVNGQVTYFLSGEYKGNCLLIFCALLIPCTMCYNALRS